MSGHGIESDFMMLCKLFWQKTCKLIAVSKCFMTKHGMELFSMPFQKKIKNVIMQNAFKTDFFNPKTKL